MTRTRLSMTGALVLSAASFLAGQAQRAGAFTAAQADAGRRAIQVNSFGACTDCHGTALGGRTGDPGEVPRLDSLSADYQKLILGNGGRVPALVGPAFMARWANRSTTDLVAEFDRRFAPPSSRLSDETRLAMIAYILQANGALPGGDLLTRTTDVAIGSLTDTFSKPDF